MNKPKAQSSGKVTASVAARDVTDSDRVLHELAETKNFLDNILQSSTKYSIIGKDLNRKILSWNEGATRNYGYSVKDIIGKSSDMLHVPEDIKSGIVDKLHKTAQEKGLAEGEFQRIRKDGSRFTASVVLTRRNDPSGHPIGYLLMSNDISEQKQASQYSRSLIEASLDPLVTISPDGKITDVNEGSIKVTGVPREKLVGTDFSNYFTEPVKAREGYQQVFKKGLVSDYPLTIRHKDGKLTDVLYNASVYKDAAGKVLGVFAAARDVTKSKKAETEYQILLQALDKATLVSMTDAKGDIIYANDRFVEVSKYSRETLIGKNHRILKSGNQPQSLFEDLWATISSGRVWRGEINNRARDGSFYWVDTTISPILGEDGKPQRYIAPASPLI